MNKWTKLDGLALGALGGSVLLTAVVYDRLPMRLATHFDARGVPNGFMPRELGAFVLPLVAAVVFCVVRFGALVLPTAFRDRLRDSPTDAIAFLTTALLSAIHCAILDVALRGPHTIGTLLGVVVGVFWVALGLVLPRIRRNPLVGIRTPWTLSSDENWALTHRFGSYAFIVGGLLAVVLATSGGARWWTSGVVLSAVIAAGYSFVVSRRLPPQI